MGKAKIEMEKRRKLQFEGILYILAAVVLALSAVMIWMGYGQDIEYHAERIAAIAEEMKIHPGIYRIYTTNCGGYGYVSPLFYGDLLLYPAALLVAAGCPVAVAFRLFLASIMMGAWLSMYLCVKAVWGRETAVLASYLYAFSPILLADIFIRFAVGEALAFIFLPIVLYGFYRIVLEPKKPKTDWIWLSVGMSGLIFSHIISTVLTVLMLVLLCLFFVRKIWANKKSFGYLAAAAVLTVFLTAYFTWPMLEQMATTPLFVTDRQTSNLAGNVAPVVGLFFGSEYFNLLNVIAEKLTGQADLFVTTWFPGAFGYLLFFVLVVRLRKKNHMENKNADTLLGFSIFYLAISMVPFIQPLLEPIVGFIKIAWRNLTFYILFLSIAAAIYLVKLKAQKKEKSYRIGLLLATFGTLVTFGGLTMITVHNGMYPFENLTSHSIGAGEYLTASVPDYNYAKERGDKVECLDNDTVDYEFFRGKGYSELLYDHLEGTAAFEVPVYMYRGYAAVNEETGESYELSFSENGLVEFTVEGNSSGKVKIFYEGTKIQHVSVWVSAVTVLLLIGVAWKEHHRQGSKKERK